MLMLIRGNKLMVREELVGFAERVLICRKRLLTMAARGLTPLEDLQRIAQDDAGDHRIRCKD